MKASQGTAGATALVSCTREPPWVSSGVHVVTWAAFLTISEVAARVRGINCSGIVFQAHKSPPCPLCSSRKTSHYLKRVSYQTAILFCFLKPGTGQFQMKVLDEV